MPESTLMNLYGRFPRLPVYIALARLDKPIGIYLLLWPTLQALWLAADGWPGWHLLLVFATGTVLARAAGCVMNDMADREFDRAVERTHARPLTSGQLDMMDAWIMLAVLLFPALILVLSTNLLTVALAALAVLTAAAYPYMKRLTYLPQAFLGLAFSFGIPMAFTAVSGQIDRLAWLLMIANAIWIVAYDTEYAMVDRDDDLKLGLKSSAILFGELDRLMIGVLQGLFLFIMLVVAFHIEASWLFHIGLVSYVAFFAYQQYLIRDRDRDACFRAFLNNHWAGLVMLVSVMADLWWRST
tara:strand:+ start:16215 stop:17111 length:897 start_codon:yes stop_codon:yes gene_type:complete